ncbi:MAG: hypothetical protein A2340_04225 [Lentisphaerae bacterium RIFOXYB12_FULL_60_10]|nr:MAG: hypothetical protein A2340_04225 [Lentisphaerae bacterium RIFOXYB12_FULL_60_10]
MNDPDTLALELLETALRQVPAYRSWQPLDPGPSASLDDRFAALPALTKADMRACTLQDILRPGVDLDRALATGMAELVTTSGSTGDRVTNVWDQSWWNASEKSACRYHPVAARRITGTHREAILASPLCTGVASTDGQPVPIERRQLDRFLYLNEFVDPAGWSSAHMDRMLAEIDSFRPEVLEANPSYLAALARYAQATHRSPSSPSLVIFTFENPSRLHVRQVTGVFPVPAVSSYGTTETGYVFMECEAGRLHQNRDYCRVDFQPLKPEHGGPDIGRILVTPFHHPWQLLLRFDVGDLVRRSATPCPCGRNDGMVLDAIEGRAINLTLTPDGRAVTQRSVDQAVADIPGLATYQLIQESPAAYTFRYLELPGTACSAHDIRDALVALYGPDAAIDIQSAASIPVDPPGKYRLTRAQFDIPIIPLLMEQSSP